MTWSAFPCMISCRAEITPRLRYTLAYRQIFNAHKPGPSRMPPTSTPECQDVPRAHRRERVACMTNCLAGLNTSVKTQSVGILETLHAGWGPISGEHDQGHISRRQCYTTPPHGAAMPFQTPTNGSGRCTSKSWDVSGCKRGNG